MKRIKVILLLILVGGTLFAPEWKCLYINRSLIINPYESLIDAITYVESHNGTYPYNAKEGAVGWFQIRQIRVDHYNKLTNNNYKLEDFYDYDLSKQMFLYYAQGKSYEKAAKDWNGSGPMTEVYWGKVKEQLSN